MASPTTAVKARSGTRAGAAVALLSLAACSAPDPAPPAATPAATAPTAAPAGAPDPAAADCSRAGPLACAIAPIANLASGSCAALTACLAGRDTGEFGPGRIEAAVACEPPVFAPNPDAESDADSDAPALGGLLAAAVAAPLEVDGPPAHGAYLFVTADGSWCPADELAAPTWNHGGYCEMRFDMSWQSADGGDGPLLVTSAERTCHIALDQQELAAGESDVALVECRRTTHRFDDGALIRVSQTDSDGPCEMR